MSLTLVSSAPFVEKMLPCWFESIPTKTSDDQKIEGDWCNVTVVKRDDAGHVIKTVRPIPFTFTQEISTGDLYGIGKSRPDSPAIIAFKAVQIFFGIFIYAPGIMLVNLIRIITDTLSIFCRVMKDVGTNYMTKSFASFLGNIGMVLVYEIPSAISEDIWRIARTPIFALGLQAACLFAIISPFEGRKWIAKCELEWHQNVTYRSDLSRVKNIAEDFGILFSALQEGRILYLANCMQKRGNIKDTVNGKPRFEIYP